MFITLEGPEGSGKTTQMPLLAEALRARGYTVHATREPGGTEISAQIRQVLMDMRNKNMNPRTELLLFCAARAQLVDEYIRPRLARGEVVLCDRYADSTLAYQGYGHGLDLAFLRTLLDFATGGLKPDLTLLLDVEVSTGLMRKQSEGEWNRMDDYERAFHERVRAGYLEMASADPRRWRIIDAGQPFEVVQSTLLRAALESLSAR